MSDSNSDNGTPTTSAPACGPITESMAGRPRRSAVQASTPRFIRLIVLIGLAAFATGCFNRTVATIGTATMTVPFVLLAVLRAVNWRRAPPGRGPVLAHAANALGGGLSMASLTMAMMNRPSRGFVGMVTLLCGTGLLLHAGAHAIRVVAGYGSSIPPRWTAAALRLRWFRPIATDVNNNDDARAMLVLGLAAFLLISGGLVGAVFSSDRKTTEDSPPATFIDPNPLQVPVPTEISVPPATPPIPDTVPTVVVPPASDDVGRVDCDGNWKELLAPASPASPAPDPATADVAYSVGGGPAILGCGTHAWQERSGVLVMELVPAAPGFPSGLLVGTVSDIAPVQAKYTAPVLAALDAAEAGEIPRIVGVEYIKDGVGDQIVLHLASGGCELLHRTDYASPIETINAGAWQAIDTLLLDGSNLPMVTSEGATIHVEMRPPQGWSPDGATLDIAVTGEVAKASGYSYRGTTCSLDKLRSAAEIGRRAHPEDGG